MRRECQEHFPYHLGLAIPTSIAARAWRTCRDACRDRKLAVSFEISGGRNVPGLPGGCETRNVTYLARGPRSESYYFHSILRAVVLEFTYQCNPCIIAQVLQKPFVLEHICKNHHNSATTVVWISQQKCCLRDAKDIDSTCTFDSTSSGEQHLLKCCTTLSTALNIERTLLIQIMRHDLNFTTFSVSIMKIYHQNLQSRSLAP